MNEELKKKIKIFMLVLLVGTQVFFLWHLDISVGVMNSSRGGILSNGFANYDPLIIYHLSLYGIIFITLLICTILGFYVIGCFDKKPQKTVSTK